MSEFGRGDIVRLKTIDVDIDYYEVLENSFDDIGECSVGKTYPPTLKFRVERFKCNELELVAKYEGEDYDLVSRFIIKEQEVFLNNRNKKIGNQPVTLGHAAISALNSMDECLDMINHLKTLHKIFNKDIYLEYIKDVEEKAKRLS